MPTDGGPDVTARSYAVPRAAARDQLIRDQSVRAAQPFQPLPPPKGAAPYHLKLADVLGPATVQAIEDAGALTFHVIGDTGGVKNPADQQIVALTMEKDFAPGTLRVPSFCYILGDLIYYNGERAQYYPQFYEPYAHYPAPILAIAGNHDGDALAGGEPSLAAFMDNFCAAQAHVTPEAQDVPRNAMTQPNVYWTLEAPFVWIVGVYSNVPEGGQLDNDQIDWLHSELTAVPNDVALIVTMHHPIYSMDQFHGGSAYMGGLLDAAVAASGRTPDAVLTGHVHNYQRFTRAVGARELPYIVSGAGGYWHLHYMAKDDLGQPLPQGSPWPVPGTDVVLENYCEDRHGFLRLTASASTLHGDYVSVPHSQESWRNGPVTTVDTFTLDLTTHTLGGIPSPAPVLIDTARLRTDAEDARRYLEEALHHVRSADGVRLVEDAEAAISRILGELH